MTEQYENNPLHGLKLETLITELVDFYGYEILGEALNFKCFQMNPSIKGSMKFLKKTEWAREKIEAFYLYKFKNLPRPDNTQYALPPRDRIIPEHQKPREPVTFTLEELKEANERKRKQAADRPRNKPGTGAAMTARATPAKAIRARHVSPRVSQAAAMTASIPGHRRGKTCKAKTNTETTRTPPAAHSRACKHDE